jgi:adenylosuccinate lyase
MVPRYARPAMTAIWEPEARYRIWFEIEAHAAVKMGEMGTVPASAGQALWDWWATNPKIDVAAIDAIEAVTKHDVIAFLDWVAQQVGPEARFMHQGMTSSDVLDTTLNVQLAKAADILLEDLDALLAAIKRRAEEHKYTPTIGRSHGIHAEPVTFGLKLAEAYAEFSRCRKRLVAAREEIATCAISGAVGTFANVDPAVEQYVADKLGLAVEPVSTQVIPRDRQLDRTARRRSAPPAAHRSPRSRRILLARPEGFVGDAAQAQPRPH